MKTHITLKKNETEMTIINIVDNTHVFNRKIMDVVLEQYTDANGNTMNYDDIISVDTTYYKKKAIDELPNNLETFTIFKTDLMEFPNFNKQIESIMIDNCRITKLPSDLSHLENLSHFKIKNSWVSKKPIILPKKLIKLQGDNIFSTEYNEIETNNTNTNTNTNNTNTIPLQTTSIPIPIPISINSIVNKINVLDSTQTVHISSIVKSVIDSVKIITEIANKYPPINNPVKRLLLGKNATLLDTCAYYFTPFLISNVQNTI